MARVPEEPAREAEGKVEPREAPQEMAPIRGEKRNIQIKSQDLVIELDSEGGVFRSVRLVRFRDAAGKALELIPQDLPTGRGGILGIRTGRKEIDGRLERLPFRLEGMATDSVAAPLELELKYRDGEIEVERHLSVPERGYVLEISTRVRVAGREVPYQLELGPGIGLVHPSSYGDFSNPLMVYYKEGVERYRAKDLEEEVRVEGARWVGVDSKYFSCVVFDSERGLGGRFQARKVQVGEDEVALVAGEAQFPAKEERVKIFLGPKNHELLREIDPTLVELINYGWFGPLVRPLLLALKFVYRFVGNYGWGIIILTFLINLVLAPIRIKQMVSMKKMAVVQPRMKAIQEKYKRMKKGDPRRAKMNEEMMALYKEHGVNPLGGCLPLLIQMPFLFAFYRMLSMSIELRGAPFIWWIHDLSQHDPTYVTPILMGVTMLVQQRISPAAGDPTQRRMMMFMPVVFTVLFLNVSSGLAIYFLFSNLFGVMFQLLMERWKPELVRKPQATARGSARK